MATKPLSTRQKRIVGFITGSLRDRGYPPRVRDIAAGCGISFTSVVAYNLRKLEQAGYIRRHRDISRGIKFLTPRQEGGNVVSIPDEAHSYHSGQRRGSGAAGSCDSACPTVWKMRDDKGNCLRDVRFFTSDL
jgi:repressor LexA